MTKIDSALNGVTRLGIDTAPVIYFIEANAQFDAIATEVFRRVSRQTQFATTSVITLAEVLVQPLVKQNLRLQHQYRDLLLNSGSFETVPISIPIAEIAAGIRASYRTRLPDALQIATALHAGCEAFLTNDADLRRISEIRVVLLSELEI